jgi:hypothetical protein
VGAKNLVYLVHTWAKYVGVVPTCCPNCFLKSSQFRLNKTRSLSRPNFLSKDGTAPLPLGTVDLRCCSARLR